MFLAFIIIIRLHIVEMENYKWKHKNLVLIFIPIIFITFNMGYCWTVTNKPIK